MRRITKRFVLAVAVLGLMVGGGGHARAGLVVVPNSNATVEGDSNNAFPFNIASQRYQQVYSSSQFLSPGGPIEITQILFRPDAAFGSAFSSTLPQIQIDLSTTSATPSTLSPTFANNVGTDDTVVFNTGPLSLSSVDTGPAGGPKNFDILINLTTPFLYDPGRGNLLMDVRNFQGGRTTQFDATSSGLVTRRVWNRDVNSSTGTVDATTSGLVTEFVFGPITAIPEPASVMMGATSVLVGLGYWWQLRKRAVA